MPSPRPLLTTFLHALETVALDVAAGALGAALFLADVSGAGALPWSVLAALVAAVLAVYNVDHLLDSYRPEQPAFSRRRRYRTHRGWLAGCAIGAVVCGAVAASFLPARVWRIGLLLVGYQAAYFVGIKAGLRGAAKRLGAAVGWTAGISLPAWAAGARFSEWLWGAGLLALLAWINLQSYAVVEARGEGEAEPGRPLRTTSIGLLLVLLAGALVVHPEHLWRWLALLGVAVAQVVLVRVPVDLLHPLGEWGFALLGLLALW